MFQCWCQTDIASTSDGSILTVRYVPFQPTSVNIMLPRLLNTLRYTSRIITDTLHIQFSWKRERGPSMCAVDKVRADRCIVFSFATVLQSGPPNSVHSVASIACANSNVNTLNPIPCWHSIRFFLGNPQPYLPVILFAMKFRLEGPVDHGVGSSWHPWLRNSRRTSVSCHLIFFVSWSQDYVAKKSEKDVQEMSRESVAKLWFGDWIVWGPVLPDISQLDYPGIPIIMYLWWCCPKFQIWLQGPVAPSIDPIKHKCPTLQVSSGKWAKYHKSSIPFWNLHRTQTWKSTSVKHGAQRLSKHRAHQQWTAQGLRMMLCVTILSWTHDNALFAIIDSMASNLNTACSSIRSFILMGKTR